MAINTQIQVNSAGLTEGDHFKVEAEMVLNCLDQDILIISKDFKILFANTKFLQKLGMDKEKVLGKFCYEITHHRTSICKPPQDPCPIIKLMQTHLPAVEVHTHLDQNNNEFFVNVIAAPIMQENICLGYLHIAIPTINKTLKTSEANNALQKVQDVLNVIDLYQKQMLEIKRKSQAVEKTKQELELKLKDLEKFNKLTVNRELKMIELKKRIRELETVTAPKHSD